MDNTYTYICDKCKNEIVSDEQTIITCIICGNKIDTRQEVWNKQQEQKPKGKVSKFWFIFFVILISSTLFKLWVRNDRKEMEKEYSKMRAIITAAYIDADYQINYPVRLKKEINLPVFKNTEAISNLGIRSGETQNFIVNVISYTSSDSIYSNIKASRDTIIKNFVAVEFSAEILDESFSTSQNRFHSLDTKGVLRSDNHKIGLRILSDHDSETQKNYHLIAIYDISKQNEAAADSLMSSRHLGSPLDYIE